MLDLYGACAVGLLLVGVTSVFAQNYPNKTIRIVTAEAGGSADSAARPLAQYLSTALSNPVVVENRAGQVVSGDIVARASPDGYTLLAQGGGFWIGSLLQHTPYDPITDFTAVAMISRTSSLLVVYPSIGVDSVKELIALAKAKPGQLNYAHGSSGSSSHLGGAMFKVLTGVDMVFIPYRGPVQALTDVIAGRAQVMIPNPASATPHVKTGRLKALAVTSEHPSALFPGLPTVAATVPGFRFEAMTVIFAPARTPEAIVRRLNEESIRFVNLAETRERFLSSGVEPASGSPQEAAALVKNEMALWSRIIKQTGIKVGL